MTSDEQSDQEAEQSAPVNVQPIFLLPFGIQLQNICTLEINAKRFLLEPVDNNATASFNIVTINVNPETLQAQVVLEVQVNFPEEPRHFEIAFKLLGQFIYEKEYSPEMVGQFLQQGSLSIMLPFARETLFSLCIRLQIPPIMFALVQLAASNDTKSEKFPQ